MTTKELAEKLNLKEYREEIPAEILKEAKDNGLVIVYGHSDDLMEIEGAISDEGGCYGGEKFRIDAEGLLPDKETVYEEDDEEALVKWVERRKKCKVIHAVWCAEGEPSWIYKTSIPHETFNVMEDGEVQCRGIVFDIKDLS